MSDTYIYLKAFDERDETRRWLLDIALRLGITPVDDATKDQRECWRNLYWLILQKLPETKPADQPHD